MATMNERYQQSIPFFGNKPVPYRDGKVRRRQFSSCDQCRKGKRGCNFIERQEDLWSIPGPCSTCSKTGKECTFEWLKSRGEFSREKEENLPGSDSHIDEIQYQTPNWNQGDWCPSDQILGGSEHALQSSISMPVYLDPMFGADPLNLSENESVAPYAKYNSSNYPMHSTNLNTIESLSNEDSVDGVVAFDAQNTFEPIASINSLDQSYKDMSEGPARPKKKPRRSSMPTPSNNSGTGGLNKLSNKRHLTNGVRRFSHCTIDPSSASLEYRLAFSTNKAFISGSLLRVYHDSMENALSCWLTEKTCPYDMEVQPYLGKVPFQKTHSNEWGSMWSNRIYERVCNLDKSSSLLRGKDLTPSEERLVEVALRTTVMAFATQWAYSSNRSSSTFTVGDNTASNDPDFRTEFDRMMQEKLWHEARNSLHATTEISSFRLVFANIIFALTQRPLNIPQSMDRVRSEVQNNPGSQEARDQISESSLLSDATATSPSEVQDLLDRVFELEGPPFYLEKALREMFSYRCKLEKMELQDRTRTNNDPKYGDFTAPLHTWAGGPLGITDRQTFNLLYWLAVMFDTLSAAIKKRPLVVSDEDSEILRENEEHSDLNLDQHFEMFANSEYNPSSGTTNSDDNDSELWGGFFFRQDRLQINEPTPRWPCSHEAAAATLSSAAPIKVVLFRRVTRLQTLMSRRARSGKLEIAIDDALVVHDYWNTRFGPFIRDCIMCHETLPPRIQSWYIVLAGHWHLAGLLLADLIEDIDQLQIGSAVNRAIRTSKNLVTSLRLHNAFAISDLGKCSCPHSESSFSRAREFHGPVNNGALLTEPWTEVLIRSFSKACSVLLDMFSTSNNDLGFNLDLLENRCESCVKALWYLGKKSDIALMASSMLSEELKKVTLRIRTRMEIHLPQCVVTSDIGLTCSDRVNYEWECRQIQPDFV